MDWQQIYNRITFSHYPFSPLHFILWGFPIVLIILLLIGIRSFLAKDKSILSYAAYSSFWSGSIVFLALIVSFYLGNSPNNVGWVIVPIVLLVSFITSSTASEKQFLGGVLTGLMSFASVILISFPFILFIGLVTTWEPRGLIAYLGTPVSAVLGYLWLVLLYPVLLVLVGSFSFLGSLINHKRELGFEIKRSLLPLIILLVLIVGTFSADIFLEKSQIKERRQQKQSVSFTGLTTNLSVNNQDIYLVEIDINLETPTKGDFELLTPFLAPSDYDFHSGGPYLGVSPQQLVINGVTNKIASGVTLPHKLTNGSNKIKITYYPDVNRVSRGPYQFTLHINLDGGREKISQKYLTESFK